MTDVEALLPHRGAMRLLDRIVSVDDTAAVVEVDVHPQATFADADGVPAWVGLEYMAQAMAAWIGARARDAGGTPKRGVVLGTRRYTAHVPTFPLGTTLRVVATPEASADGVSTFRCTLGPDAATTWCEAVVTAMVVDGGGA